MLIYSFVSSYTSHIISIPSLFIHQLLKNTKVSNPTIQTKLSVQFMTDPPPFPEALGSGGGDTTKRYAKNEMNAPFATPGRINQ
ncbi:hypothetical protein EYC80_009647 [Monilinia laxa]|uniref:Uncharacterized protein n=1 Tax=Monilinia laxa TaxID=61186 RepID=A0A5N6JYH6_MONLA|nr:hypothetical protein EYC80_009647 [Monilinia laxa]